MIDYNINSDKAYYDYLVGKGLELSYEDYKRICDMQRKFML